MSERQRRWEWFIQAVIACSLIVHLIDLHLPRDEERAGIAHFIDWIDWIITGIFTIEYFIRWYHAPDWKRYPFTLMALIDLLVIIPFFISLFLDLRSLRLIRILRVFQLLKLYRYNKALQGFVSAFRRIVPQLQVVGVVVVIVAIIASTAMFECEHQAQADKFRHIGDSLWWCIVTLTTVGYGDLFPITNGGRWVATATVIIGLGIFGTLISLIGSAFITALQEEEHHTIYLSKPMFRQLRQSQHQREEPTDIETLRHVADEAVRQYLAKQESKAVT